MPAKDLIFLHGGNHGSWCWAPLVAELEKTPDLYGRIILLDVPGAGKKRGQNPESETIASVARKLNDELRNAGVRKGTLIGHSLAGVLMPVMAAEDSSLYADLFFLQTIAPNEGQTVYEQMGTSAHGVDPEKVGYPIDPASVPHEEFLLAAFGVDMTEEQQRWLLAELAQDATPLAFVQEPATRKGYDPSQFRTVHVCAKRDPILPMVWQHRFAERLGCREIVEIDTPHEAFITHPKVLADAIRGLIG